MGLMCPSGARTLLTVRTDCRLIDIEPAVRDRFLTAINRRSPAAGIGYPIQIRAIAGTCPLKRQLSERCCLTSVLPRTRHMGNALSVARSVVVSLHAGKPLSLTIDSHATIQKPGIGYVFPGNRKGGFLHGSVCRSRTFRAGC